MSNTGVSLQKPEINIDLDKHWLRELYMSTFINTTFLHVNIKLLINMMIVQFDIIYLEGGGGVKICRISPHPVLFVRLCIFTSETNETEYWVRSHLCLVKKSLALVERIHFFI